MHILKLPLKLWIEIMEYDGKETWNYKKCEKLIS